MSGISNEYAKALFMLAVENKGEEEYKNALELVSAVFKSNPEYMLFLRSLSISLAERHNSLEAVFKGRIPAEVLSFLKLLCKKKYMGDFGECAEEFFALYNNFKKISNAKVTSAVELTEAQKTAVAQKLEKQTGKKLVVEYFVDSSIIGGLVVETDGKIIDSSIKKHLEDVKDVIRQ